MSSDSKKIFPTTWSEGKQQMEICDDFFVKINKRIVTAIRKMIDYEQIGRKRRNLACFKFLTQRNQLVDVLVKYGEKVIQLLVIDLTFLTRWVKLSSVREDASKWQELWSVSARWRPKGRRQRLYGAP